MNIIHRIDQYDPNVHISISDIHKSFGVLSCVIAYNIENVLSDVTDMKSEIGIISMIRDNIAFKNIVPNVSFIDGQSYNTHREVLRLFGNSNEISLMNKFKDHVHAKRNLLYQHKDGSSVDGTKTIDDILSDINAIVIDTFMKNGSKYSADISGLVHNIIQQIEKYFNALDVTHIIEIKNIESLANEIDAIVDVFNFSVDNRMIIDVDLQHPFIIFPHRFYLEKQEQIEKMRVDDIVFLKNELPDKFDYSLVRTLRDVCSAQGDDMVLYPLGCYKDLKRVKLLIGLGAHRQDVCVCVNYEFISDVLT